MPTKKRSVNQINHLLKVAKRKRDKIQKELNESLKKIIKLIKQLEIATGKAILQRPLTSKQISSRQSTINKIQDEIDKNQDRINKARSVGIRQLKEGNKYKAYNKLIEKNKKLRKGRNEKNKNLKKLKSYSFKYQKIKSARERDIRKPEKIKYGESKIIERDIIVKVDSKVNIINAVGQSLKTDVIKKGIYEIQIKSRVPKLLKKGSNYILLVTRKGTKKTKGEPQRIEIKIDAEKMELIRDDLTYPEKGADIRFVKFNYNRNLYSYIQDWIDVTISNEMKGLSGKLKVLSYIIKLRITIELKKIKSVKTGTESAIEKYKKFKGSNKKNYGDLVYSTFMKVHKLKELKAEKDKKKKGK